VEAVCDGETYAKYAKFRELVCLQVFTFSRMHGGCVVVRKTP
jgi:hypothetical protein